MLPEPVTTCLPYLNTMWLSVGLLSCMMMATATYGSTIPAEYRQTPPEYRQAVSIYLSIYAGDSYIWVNHTCRVQTYTTRIKTSSKYLSNYISMLATATYGSTIPPEYIHTPPEYRQAISSIYPSI